VIKHFLKLASDKAEAAQAQAETLADVEDLEASATPETLMLSYVSVENDKARADRQLVTPWFKCVLLMTQPLYNSPIAPTRACEPVSTLVVGWHEGCTMGCVATASHPDITLEHECDQRNSKDHQTRSEPPHAQCLLSPSLAGPLLALSRLSAYQRL